MTESDTRRDDPRLLTPMQRRLLLVLTLIIGLTRFAAMAHSMFDWDEGLFALAVQEFDVAQYRPHPPGYPLFVAAAKVVHLAGASEFHSLQAITVLGSLFLFPALVFFAMECGLGFGTTVGGAAIFVFLPNVWVYGGTGFSDVPALTIGLVACGLLLRGRRDVRSYVLGAAVLGIAAGFRPTNLFIGAAPALIATWSRARARSYRSCIAALLLGGVIVGGIYLGSAMASSSISEFAQAIRIQSKYIHDVDSFHGPGRPPLGEMANLFFVTPFHARQLTVAIALLACISLLGALVRRRAAPLVVLATFAPAAITAWLNFDYETASRYAVTYMPGHALLAADGAGLVAMVIAMLVRGSSRETRRPAATRAIQAAICTIIIALSAIWTWPALRTQRSGDAPPAAALEWVSGHASPSATVYVRGDFDPEARFLLPGRRIVLFSKSREIPLSSGDAWVVGVDVTENGRNYIWPHHRLWKIVRRRGFEVSVRRAADLIRFGDGWYAKEGVGASSFRWMAGRSEALLPSLRGTGTLTASIIVPEEARPPTTIEVRWNGTLVERIEGAGGRIDRAWVLESRHDVPNELRITTSATFNPSRLSDSPDTRELGLRFETLRWTPAD